MKRGLKKHLLTGLKLLFSGSLMYLVYRRIPMSDLAGILGSVDFRYLLPIAVLLFFNTVLSAWKWRLPLQADGIVHPYRHLPDRLFLQPLSPIQYRRRLVPDL